MEPALTNIGIVLPEDGFLAAVRDACTRTGTLLIIDETHTLSAGPGGCTAAWGLEPDAVTLGKSIGGGVPIGAYGVTAELAERIATEEEGDYEDTGGVGGTLAGNALSLAATRATLGGVLTDSAFAEMSRLRERFVAGVQATLERHSVPWSIVSLGARAEYRFAPEPPRTGAESEAAGDREIEEYLHLYLLNRGVLITPFHSMALMCPATTPAQVDRHTEAFGEAVEELARMTEHHEHHAAQAGDKGLKQDAIGFLDGLVIGIASTAPAYSLAAVLAIVVVGWACRRPP